MVAPTNKVRVSALARRSGLEFSRLRSDDFTYSELPRFFILDQLEVHPLILGYVQPEGGSHPFTAHRAFGSDLHAFAGFGKQRTQRNRSSSNQIHSVPSLMRSG